MRMVLTTRDGGGAANQAMRQTTKFSSRNAGVIGHDPQVARRVSEARSCHRQQLQQIAVRIAEIDRLRRPAVRREARGGALNHGNSGLL